MPAYLVVPYDSGPTGFPGMQALINEKAAEGYALHQVIERSTYQWVPIPMKPPLCSEMIAPPVSGMISPPV